MPDKRSAENLSTAAALHTVTDYIVVVIVAIVDSLHAHLVHNTYPKKQKKKKTCTCTYLYLYKNSSEIINFNIQVQRSKNNSAPTSNFSNAKTNWQLATHANTTCISYICTYMPTLVCPSYIRVHMHAHNARHRHRSVVHLLKKLNQQLKLGQ